LFWVKALRGGKALHVVKALRGGKALRVVKALYGGKALHVVKALYGGKALHVVKALYGGRAVRSSRRGLADTAVLPLSRFHHQFRARRLILARADSTMPARREIIGA